MAGRHRKPGGIWAFVAGEVPPEVDPTGGGRLLWQCLGKQRRWSTMFVAATVFRGVAALALPLTLAGAIDTVARHGPLTAALGRVGLVLAVFAAAEALAEVSNAYYGAGVLAELRGRLVRQVLRLGVAEPRFGPGELLSRLSVDVAGPTGFLSLAVGCGCALLTLIGAVTALWLIDWTLGVAVVLGIPLAAGAVRAFVGSAGAVFLRYQQLQAEIVDRLVDAVGGARTIRACGTEDRERGRILEPLPELHATGRKVWAAERQVSWQLLLLVPTLQIVVLCVGGFGVAAGRITPGQLVAAAAYVLVAVDSLEIVDGLVAALHSRVGAARVATVLSRPPEVTSPPVARELPPGPGRVELADVLLRRDGRRLLDGLTLTVPAGTSVAVVGRSGAGKSALVSLIGRLGDPDAGSVRLDGVPVTELALPRLRHSVAYAFARPALLGRTLHDTIAYARPEASRAEVVRAASAAEADAFIRLLPAGYDTPVAEARLSGGEVQRLGLARAILADARVIVLDDAMSSLDTATEVKIADALARQLSGRTSLVVAHRAGTAARADLVAWLDSGKIRALAPHRVLWADPAYRRTFTADGQPDGAEAVIGS